MASLPRNPAKMKGLLKGLRYISQIFDEEKEQEIEIGLPTDVKHVAHIGWDGPSIESPSWMKDFKSPSNFQSAPLNVPGGPQDRGEPEIKWVSEDGKGEKQRNKSKEEGTKSSRRNRNGENTSDQSPKKERSRRKQHSKDSSDSVKSTRHLQDGTDSPSKGPDIPKKSRRKKSKEYMNGGTSGKLKSKGERGDSSSTPVANESGSHKSKKKGDRSSLKSDIDVSEKEISGIF